jgi:hypothetical protein
LGEDAVADGYALVADGDDRCAFCGDNDLFDLGLVPSAEGAFRDGFLRHFLEVPWTRFGGRCARKALC